MFVQTRSLAAKSTFRPRNMRIPLPPGGRDFAPLSAPRRKSWDSWMRNRASSQKSSIRSLISAGCTRPCKQRRSEKHRVKMWPSVSLSTSGHRCSLQGKVGWDLKTHRCSIFFSWDLFKDYLNVFFIFYLACIMNFIRVVLVTTKDVCLP